MKAVEVIEKINDTMYQHTIIDLYDDKGTTLMMKRNLTILQFKEILKEGGWNKGVREDLETKDPYMFRVHKRKM